MQKISFYMKKENCGAFYKISPQSYIILSRYLLYLVYIQWFRKSIHLEILSFLGQQRQKGVGRNLAARRSGKVRRRAEKVASRARFTPSEGKNERSKNAGYEAEMGIFYPHSCRKVKRIYRKRWKMWTNFRIS